MVEKLIDNTPLVSIGVPTYNRPASLRITLDCILQQTYSNTEIIVSDNCSTNEEVWNVIQEYVQKDKRIRSFRQESNIGPIENFKFVLSEATGRFFMWAADDDERSPEFIEHLLSIIGDKSAAYCNYLVKYLATNHTETFVVSKNYSTHSGKYAEAKSFLLGHVPLIYGLYKREDLCWLKSYTKVYDWFDFYLSFRTILLGNGYAVADKKLITYVFPGDRYEFKPMLPTKGKLFTYLPYFREGYEVIRCSRLKCTEKWKLIFFLFHVNLKSFMHLETRRKNYPVYNFFFQIYNGAYSAINKIRSIRRLYQ